MNQLRGYKNLKTFQKAEELVLLIYKVTKDFPKTETYGLVDQIKRASISVMANIAEGCGRQTIKDRIHFLYMARGSLIEVECFIDLSLKLKYINEKQHGQLVELRNEVGKLLNGLIKSLKKGV
jgi:four helix bundle protein